MKLISTVVNLVLLAGTTLLLLFIVLSGSTDHFPFNEFYIVKANTSDIPGAPSESAWSFWGVCDANDWNNCTFGPAFPLSPKDNFHTEVGVPQDFIANRDTYYYLSRFAFAFAILALAFTGFAFLVDLFGLCFSFVDKIVVVLSVIALFFVAAFASVLTAVTILARNAFNSDGMSGKIGVKYLALTWASFVCVLLVFFLTCAANIAASYKKHLDKVRESESQAYYQSAPGPSEVGAPIGDESSFTRDNALTEKDDPEDGGIRFFRIKRNQKPTDEESV